MPSPSRATSPALTTSALCAAAGVTRGVLRRYEREGNFLLDFMAAGRAAPVADAPQATLGRALPTPMPTPQPTSSPD